MKGFIIAALDANGGHLGYYNGVDFENMELDDATFIPEKVQARGALGNLQRTNSDKDLTLVEVERKTTLAKTAQATV